MSLTNCLINNPSDGQILAYNATTQNWENNTNGITADVLNDLQDTVAALEGALVYKGTYNASTDTPTLTSGTHANGDYYICSVAGSQDLNGTGAIELHEEDMIIFHDIDGGGSQWDILQKTSYSVLTHADNILTGDNTFTGSITGANLILSTNDSLDTLSITNTGGGVGGANDTAIYTKMGALSGARYMFRAFDANDTDRFNIASNGVTTCNSTLTMNGRPITGVASLTGSSSLTVNTVSNGNINLTPNGTGEINCNSLIDMNNNNISAIGEATHSAGGIRFTTNISNTYVPPAWGGSTLQTNEIASLLGATDAAALRIRSGGGTNTQNASGIELIGFNATNPVDGYALTASITHRGRFHYFRNFNDTMLMHIDATSINAEIPLDMGSNKITNLTDPTAAQDAATKAYVDSEMLAAGVISSVEFTTSDTWVVPSGVETILISATGAGGSGADNTDNTDGAAGGGSGAYIIRFPVQASPSDTLTITIGAGGVALHAGSGQGQSGGSTTISFSGSAPDLILSGGAGGGTVASGASGGPGGGDVANSPYSSAGRNGGTSSTIGESIPGRYIGGTGTSGGGGGASYFAAGGDGGVVAGGGVAGTLGSGGGGGGRDTGSSNHFGGDGGSGYVLIEYY